MSERFVFAVKWKRISFIPYTAKVGPSPVLLVCCVQKRLEKEMGVRRSGPPRGLGLGAPKGRGVGLVIGLKLGRPQCPWPVIFRVLDNGCVCVSLAIVNSLGTREMLLPQPGFMLLVSCWHPP